MIPLPGKGVLVAGALGAVACLFLWLALAAEKNRHADTKQQLADQKANVAAIQTQHAEQAADRAEAAAAELDSVREQFLRMQRDASQLRQSLSNTEALREADRMDAEQRIEGLKRENEELMAWAVSTVPADWIVFMREPIDAVADAP